MQHVGMCCMCVCVCDLEEASEMNKREKKNGKWASVAEMQLCVVHASTFRSTANGLR